MIEILPGIEGTIALPLNRLISLKDSGLLEGLSVSPVRPLNITHVYHLMHATKVPAIEVAHIRDTSKVLPNYGVADDFVCVDGRHRWEAASRKEESTIEAHVGSYATISDIIEAALSANINHGLPANNDSRTAYAMWMYENDPSYSAEDIASIVGISARTIERDMQKLEGIDLSRSSTVLTTVQKEARLFISGIARFVNRQQRNTHRLIRSETHENDIAGIARDIQSYLSTVTSGQMNRAISDLETIRVILEHFLDDQG